MTITRTGAIALLAMMTLTTQPDYKSWPLRQAPEELRSSISRADLVIVAIQSTVLRELADALAREGAARGLGFCHVDATDIAQRLSGNERILAGRTSDRLRNIANAPRSWAAPFVAAHAGQRAKGVDGYVVDLGDRVGVLRPIVEQPICGECHGAVDRLAPGVKMSLRQRYPADQAVGYHDGDIRGWFWVEMPKNAR